jgi:hypothetical protein
MSFRSFRSFTSFQRAKYNFADKCGPMYNSGTSSKPAPRRNRTNRQPPESPEPAYDTATLHPSRNARRAAAMAAVVA